MWKPVEIIFRGIYFRKYYVLSYSVLPSSELDRQLWSRIYKSPPQ